MEAILNFPNLLWAVSQFGNRYQLAAAIGCSESWLSRRLIGRVSFSSEEREVIAQTLGYPADWLFQEPHPPARTQISNPAPVLESPESDFMRRRRNEDATAVPLFAEAPE